MARAKKVETEGKEETGAPSGAFVLARNFAMVYLGKHHWWPKGERFEAEDDAALISALHQAGATFE